MFRKNCQRIELPGCGVNVGSDVIDAAIAGRFMFQQALDIKSPNRVVEKTNTLHEKKLEIHRDKHGEIKYLTKIVERKNRNDFGFEAKLSRLLLDAATVESYDEGRKMHVLRITMPYFGDRELYDVINVSDSINIKTALYYMFQLSSDLMKIHREGYTHGDIAPENCMVVEKENRARLIDFGGSQLESLEKA